MDYRSTFLLDINNNNNNNNNNNLFRQGGALSLAVFQCSPV